MSDLSQPLLNLLSLPASTEAASTGFVWPTPPYASFPSPQPQTEPEPCEVESPNGNVSIGLLVLFDAEAGIAHFQVPPAPGTLALTIAKLHRITLLRPLLPLENPAPGSAAALLGMCAPVSDCQLTLAHGELRELQTVGHVRHPLGHFLFPPTGQPGQVQRSFYPHAAVLNIESGPRVGELLVQQQAATEEQVDHIAAQQQNLRDRRLGEILLKQGIVAPEQLLEAIEQQARMPMVRIGEALIALGFIDERALGDALQQQNQDRKLPLGELLVQGGVVSREELQTALARKMGYPVVDAGEFPIEAEAASQLPAALARRLPALPLMMRGGRLVVALEDPSARILIDEIELAVQSRVVPVLARAGTLAPAIEHVYAGLSLSSQSAADLTSEDTVARKPLTEAGDAARRLAGLEQQLAGEPLSDVSGAEPSDSALLRLIGGMLQDAQRAGITSIHIECASSNEPMPIRWRREGRLMPCRTLPAGHGAAVVARLKAMAELDLAERRKPQQGKVSLGRHLPGCQLDIRIATFPTANQLEDLVIHLLTPARAMALDELGLTPPLLQQLKSLVERPQGLLLCAGPAGSGKTTLLHAALGHLNTPQRKLWTAEDPLEVTQKGLRQVQVNPRIDWTFAQALRSFQHADPDVVMVGALPDAETAQIAIQLALSGPLVLSAMPTHSAAETVLRLLDQGLDAHGLGDALQAVMALRLVRRLCSHCRTTRPATDEETDALLDAWLASHDDAGQAPSREALLDDWLRQHGLNKRLLQHHSPGCGHCAGTGFNGRIGLHELLVIDRDLRRLIHTRASAHAMQQAALARGMRTLRQDGIAKVLAGLTTIHEVRASSNS